MSVVPKRQTRAAAATSYDTSDAFAFAIGVEPRLTQNFGLRRIGIISGSRRKKLRPRNGERELTTFAEQARGRREEARDTLYEIQSSWRRKVRSDDRCPSRVTAANNEWRKLSPSPIFRVPLGC